jgi:hypothetical protein
MTGGLGGPEFESRRSDRNSQSLGGDERLPGVGASFANLFARGSVMTGPAQIGEGWNEYLLLWPRASITPRRPNQRPDDVPLPHRPVVASRPEA